MSQAKKFKDVVADISNVVLDKEKEAKLAITCLLSRGHLLIEDVPGVGKTTLVRALGKLCGLSTTRIQFTVDLLPGDILGGTVFDAREQKFKFRPGPIFTQMLLADELNRASPRTQSALLQAMEEDQVSIDGETHNLPQPFFVVATQNPHQQSGTFQLPESQVDRFLMALQLNFASQNVETQILLQKDPKQKLDSLLPRLSADEFLAARHSIEQIKIGPVVAEYASRILQHSRKSFSGLKNGALALSTRAGLALVRAAQAWAFLDERDYTSPEDIQAIMVPVLGHRLGGASGVHRGQLWAEELRLETPVPV